LIDFKHMKHILLTIIILGLLHLAANAQVGINNPNPDSTSVLDLQSTSKGFLIPRMNSFQRNNMSSNGNVPANALLVFDTGLKKYLAYNNTYSKWLLLNPWYSDDNNLISYGATNTSYKINVHISSNTNIFNTYSSYSGVSSDSLKFQSEYLFTDASILSSGMKFNAKLSGGDFILMKAYYNNQPMMTLKSNGNLGLGYTNPIKKLEVSGDAQASGEVIAAKFIGKGTIPIGGIIIWSGSISNIPSGWALCDGNNGTPNLKDRFIIGSGGLFAANSTGGAASVIISSTQMPSHNHTGTANNIGNHRHSVVRNQEENNGSNSAAYHAQHGTDEQYKLQRHSSDANIWNTSGAGNHTHTFNSNNSGSNQAHENTPPYYAMAYIMRTN
ncbi:MAG: hypothetical protein KAH32_00995, partial [Chlamydiia bacterium]|nr:hypothetical protein [Chlamydiia bacterium]